MECFPVEPPRVFFLPPGHGHGWAFTEISKGYVLTFRDDFLLADRQNSFPETAADTCLPVPPDEPDITSIFRKIEGKSTTQHSDYLIIIQSYLRILLTFLKRRNTQSSLLNADLRELNDHFRHQRLSKR